MAEVSYLNFQGVVVDEDSFDSNHNAVVLDRDTHPYFSPGIDNFDIFPSDLEFVPSDHLSVQPHPIFRVERRPCTPRSRDAILNGDPAAADLFDRESQMNFVMDLLHQRVEQSQSLPITAFRTPNEVSIPDSSFRVVVSRSELGLTRLQLDQGVGLCTEGQTNNDDDNRFGFMAADDGGEFFLSRRADMSRSSESSTRICRREGSVVTDLTVGDGGFDTDSDENGVVDIEVLADDNHDRDDSIENEPINNDDLSLAFRWDSFHLEDDHRGEWNDGFEWEEVDGNVDEREVLSMFDVSVSGEEETMPEVSRNLEWEVLLDVHNLELNPESVNLFGDHDGYNHTAEYEMLFGQFAENENALIGRPPAAKSVVESLPTVVLDASDINVPCAVCKDAMVVGETVKVLPCSHKYHGECILPWLGIRNTCPVCRYELRTDDPVYERRSFQRGAEGGNR